MAGGNPAPDRGAPRRPLPAGDIAVLVRTNARPSSMKAAPVRGRRPGGRLQHRQHFRRARGRGAASACWPAWPTPPTSCRLKAALATDICWAPRADDIAAGDRSPGRWDERVRTALGLFPALAPTGFIPMFRQLPVRGGACKQRLLRCRTANGA
ncbi:MAG: hypothetical protein MZV70_67725 [Desulfobacterales bacterium]|nr:hypothetical protein [Desulfobacterales bacterium]